MIEFNYTVTQAAVTTVAEVTAVTAVAVVAVVAMVSVISVVAVVAMVAVVAAVAAVVVVTAAAAVLVKKNFFFKFEKSLSIPTFLLDFVLVKISGFLAVFCV